MSFSIALTTLLGSIALPSFSLAAVKSKKKDLTYELFESLVPGRTSSSDLYQKLGKPARAIKPGGAREIYFYDLGSGANLDATVSLKKGILEYTSFLCALSVEQIDKTYGKSEGTTIAINAESGGLNRKLTQKVYESKGVGFVIDPRTLKVRACLKFEPGASFADLGR